jgi:hypothetical protein
MYVPSGTDLPHDRRLFINNMIGGFLSEANPRPRVISSRFHNIGKASPNTLKCRLSSNLLNVPVAYDDRRHIYWDLKYQFT